MASGSGAEAPRAGLRAARTTTSPAANHRARLEVAAAVIASARHLVPEAEGVHHDLEHLGVVQEAANLVGARSHGVENDVFPAVDTLRRAPREIARAQHRP